MADGMVRQRNGRSLGNAQVASLVILVVCVQ
jgi:hypothetical protein